MAEVSTDSTMMSVFGCDCDCKLPESKITVQTIQATQLPANSYRERCLITARFQPFEAFGDSFDNWGNNQMNWTNLFLLNKLGCKCFSISDITQLSNLIVMDIDQLATIKHLGSLLSDEFAKIKEQIELIATDCDLQKVKQSIYKLINQTGLAGRQSIIEAKVDRMEKLLNKIAQKLCVE